MAQASVQDQAGHHGGGTCRDCSAGTERGAAGFLRIAVAYWRVANGCGLSAGGGCGLEQPHDLLLAGKIEVARRDPAPNAPKWFAAVEMIRLAAEQDWLHKATKEISKYWRNKRERRQTPDPLLRRSEAKTDDGWQ